jgi:hypothetical protein
VALSKGGMFLSRFHLCFFYAEKAVFLSWGNTAMIFLLFALLFLLNRFFDCRSNDAPLFFPFERKK